MSTPEQPETPQLTRKQLRDIRNTGATPIIDTASTPVITADEVPAGAPADDAPVAPPPIEESLPPVAPPSPAAPLARAAEPVLLPEPPAPDRSVDLGVAPLTRRQARQQERIRTASVPVITPEISAAYAAQSLVAGSEARRPPTACRGSKRPPHRMTTRLRGSRRRVRPDRAGGRAASDDANTGEPSRSRSPRRRSSRR